MPTEYKRKGNSSRATWTEEMLQSAIQAVRTNSTGVNEAARNFKIPSTTLRRRLTTGNSKKRGLGPSSVLGEENEKKIATHIKKMQKRGFAPTRNIVRRMAYHLAEQLKIKHTFNRKVEMAGGDWLKSFLRRNSDLSVRKSEGVSLARSRGMNKKDVGDYFELLGKTLEEQQLFDKPGSVFNMDETGLQLNNKPEHVIAEKGSKNVAAVTSGEKGETITVICCCNGEGTFIPPTCIFKGKNKKKEYEDGMPPGSTLYMSEKSAYINTTIFLNWLQTQFVPRKPQGPVVLILDGHSSHCSSIEVLEYSEANAVTLLCLPSHSTQFLQPLDRGFFKAFKSYYYAACNSFIRANPTRTINRLQFGKLLTEAWSKSATVNNAISSFRATGIIPFNSDAIPEYAFLNDTETLTPEKRMRGESDAQLDEIANVNNADSTDENRENINPQIEKETPGKILNLICPIPSTSKVEVVRKRSRQLAEVLTSPENMSKKKAIADKKSKVLSAKEKKIGEQCHKIKSKNVPTKKKKSEKSRKCEDSSSESDIDIDLQTDSDSGGYNTDQETDCVGCGENYRHTTSGEDWLQCISCHKWLHEGCTTFPNHCLRCGRK